MPELPEVETTLRGIQPYIEGQKIDDVVVRHRGLRWPISPDLETTLIGQTIVGLQRRAKYLLLATQSGTLMIHLGMSGRLRVLDNANHIGKHDHVDILFGNGKLLRFTDPRRFGAIIWTTQAVEDHKLIHHLGPEPLSTSFSAEYLHQQAKGRQVNIKTFIMNSEIVVGVGNIYANEALFMAGIHPEKAAGKIKLVQISKLVEAIKIVLKKAIDAGGTTLKDFRKSDGKPGYFAQELNVYGRAKQACFTCQTPIVTIRQNQRASFYCPECQRK